MNCETGFKNGIASIGVLPPNAGNAAPKKLFNPNINPPATNAGINGTNISAKCATILCKKGWLCAAAFFTSSFDAS